jgi:hypothetical protein
MLKKPEANEPLVKVSIYMYTRQRQQLRELAARHGVPMSEYLKRLIDVELRKGQ